MKKPLLRRKFTNSLALVRAAVADAIHCRIPGDRFAELLGISSSKLRAIESGYERISDDLAETVMLLTGVRGGSLNTKYPKDLFGNEYCEESYLQFWKMSLSANGLTHVASQIRTQIDILLSAANETGTIILVLYLLVEWLKRVVEIRRFYDIRDIRRLDRQIQTMIGSKNVQSWASDFFEGIKPSLVQSANWPAIERLFGKAQLPGILALDELESQDYAVLTPNMMKALAGFKSTGNPNKDKGLLLQRIAAVSAQQQPEAIEDRPPSVAHSRKTKKR